MLLTNLFASFLWILISEALLVALILGGVFLFTGALVLGIIYGAKAYNRSLSVAQHVINDRDLLLMINAEPDNVINAEILAQTSDLSYKDAKKRLAHLSNSGLLNRLSNSSLKTFYELKEDIEDDTLIKLSSEPYLTLEDLLLLFKHHDYKMSLQDMCVSTGLPIEIIKREMKYFESEGIVHSLVRTVGYHQFSVFVLQQSYKDDPNLFQNIEEEVNLNLKKIFQQSR